MQLSRNTYSVLLLLLCLTSNTGIFAQLFGTSAFLQGCYIEVAISKCGVYGASGATPATGPFGPYHDNCPAGLGFVADHEKDGWTTSTAPGQPDQCGDYFTPGAPVEGWGVEYDGDTWYNSDVGCGYYDIDGDITGYSDTGGYKSAFWEGTLTDGDLDISFTQNTLFPDGALFFLTSVEICNNGATDLNDFYYYRNVDPDQDAVLADCGFEYTTTNTIVKQPPTTGDTALVEAVGAGCGCYLGIGSIDDRCRVSYGAFGTGAGTPSDSWTGTGVYTNIYGSTITIDGAIQIAFKIDIPAGECQTIYFAHILDESDLAQALQATLSGGIGISADGVEIDTTGITEKCKLDTLLLTILFGDDYDWTWSPSYGLSADTGSSVYAYPDTTTTYTITGVGDCAELIRQITVDVHEVTGLADAGPDTIICPDDTINLHGGGGVTYLWQPGTYLEDQTDPNTAVNIPLTDMYYFLYAFDDIGCPDTDMVYIDLKPRPDVDAGSDKIMALNTFTQLFASGAVTYVWSPGETLSDSLVYNPYAYPPDTITYSVAGTDMYGCINWDTVTVFVIDPIAIVSPNIFTPNNDGMNDSYLPGIKGLGELVDFQIYNRWGVLVYDWTENERGWDGIFENKPQELGTYIVVITALDKVKNIEVQRVSNVILMR